MSGWTGPGDPGRYGPYGAQPGRDSGIPQHGAQPGIWQPGGQEPWSAPPGGERADGPTAPGWQDAPGYGQYGQYGAPQQEVPHGFGGGEKPGIIALRPLSVGEILDAGFRAIRANPKVMFGLSVLVMGVTALITTAATALILLRLPSPQPMPAPDEVVEFEDLATMLAGDASGLLADGVSVLFIFLASTVLEGLLIISVSQSVVGRVASLGEVWQNARGQLLRLIGLALVTTLILLALYAVLFTPLVFAGASAVEGGDPGAILAVLLFFLGFALVALAGTLFLMVRLTAWAAPALMLERLGVFASLARAWRLSRGHGWRLLGILLLTLVIVTILSYVLMIPFAIAMGLVQSPEALTILTIVLSGVSVLISALTTPFMAAVSSLAYIDLRMRKEGLDVALAQTAREGRAP